jgi:signal transduction histidine kinase
VIKCCFLLNAKYFSDLQIFKHADITKRKKIEEELKELNKCLEQRVAERTTALVKTNEELQIEITEHKRTEAALIEARNKAEVANRAKSQFLANMSHELRTPLNSIIGFSEIIKDKAFGKINEKQEKHLNNINKSGKRLLGMIDDIIDLSRVDAGIIQLELQKLSIPLILSEAVETVKLTALKKNIQINTRMCGTLLTINADKDRLGKIINILLDNALKYTPDGGKIKLEANRIEDKLQVSVTDTGIGVKPESKEHIFKVFEQADGSYTRKFRGAGIGLTLAKKITQLCGGRIWVESPPGEGLALEAGKGSSFVFEIPCKAA